MAKQKTSPAMLLVIAALTIGSGMLTSTLVGKGSTESERTSFGFAVAFLVMASAVYVFMLDNPLRVANPTFGMVLVGCGTLCIVISLLLQFYLAQVGADLGRNMTEIMKENLRRGVGVHMNTDANFPSSVVAVSFLAVVVGTWLAAMGIHLAVSPRKAEVHVETDTTGHDH